MKILSLNTAPEVEMVFNNYPGAVREKLMRLRALILETAEELDGVSSMEETLKWGEPSYITKYGSTLRIDWKKKTPDHYAMYFKCTSRLVETFKSVYKDKFSFEKNRAIVFELKDRLPEKELKECIRAALNYHRVKHLPTLGI